MIYVVGSGAAGVACASALLDRGREVTILDVGLVLEPEIERQVEALAGKPRGTWSENDLRFMKAGTQTSTAGLAIKRVFGSDFTYRGTEKDLPLRMVGVATRPSFARGGLTTAWGGAVLPFHDDDIADWPVRLKDLEPHYRAVLQLMPFSAAHDDLEEPFPLYTDRPLGLDPSRQLRALLSDLSDGRQTLSANGIRFGSSRLAVQGRDGAKKSGCIYCGQCMYGCPFGYIYSAAQTLQRLLSRPGFHYQDQFVVKRVTESDAGVTLSVRDLRRNESLTITADRVYLAAGVLSTSRLLMASMDLYDSPVPMVSSQHFLLPWLRYRGTPNVAGEPLHTLAQAFIEIQDRDISPEFIHLQVYGYSDLYPRTLSGLSWGLLDRMSGLRDVLLSRLLIIQGYLHSKHSSQIRLTLRRAQGDTEPVLEVASEPRPLAAAMLRRLGHKLFHLRSVFRALPITPAMDLSAPGYGFHNGGTFPMALNAGPGQSDTSGRPYGFRRLHVVDGTVLPSIPATTITFSIMANAHRIGSLDV